jgi:RNA polymerase sigma-70 factor (ECF subfamily)
VTITQLEQVLEGCRRGNRASQEHLYRQFFALGMSVCIRYARVQEEAREMCNDGFERIFKNIGSLREPAAFKGWFRTLMVRASVDYHRKYFRAQLPTDSLDFAAEVEVEPSVLDALSADEKLALVQEMPPSLRVVFNLYAVEGYNTAEIAVMLGIEEGTARANLVRARTRLKLKVQQAELIKQN